MIRNYLRFWNLYIKIEHEVSTNSQVEAKVTFGWVLRVSEGRNKSIKLYFDTYEAVDPWLNRRDFLNFSFETIQWCCFDIISDVIVKKGARYEEELSSLDGIWCRTLIPEELRPLIHIVNRRGIESKHKKRLSYERHRLTTELNNRDLDRVTNKKSQKVNRQIDARKQQVRFGAVNPVLQMCSIFYKDSPCFIKKDAGRLYTISISEFSECPNPTTSLIDSSSFIIILHGTFPPRLIEFQMLFAQDSQHPETTKKLM